MLRFLAALFALSLPAQADEVWTTKFGDIVYEADVGEDAVLSFIHPDGSRAMLVIPGLAGNYNFRGEHDGYWIGSVGGVCQGTMTHPKAGTSTTWGRALIVFDKPAFPTSFSLTVGDCFNPLYTSIRAISTAE